LTINFGYIYDIGTILVYVGYFCSV